MTRITDEALDAAALALADEVRKWPLDSSLPHDSRVGVGATFQELARAALEAALPHLEGATPAIDRGALLQVVAEYIDDLDAVPPMGTSAEHLERRAVHVTDAVIAHLSGGAS